MSANDVARLWPFSTHAFVHCTTTILSACLSERLYWIRYCDDRHFSTHTFFRACLALNITISLSLSCACGTPSFIVPFGSLVSLTHFFRSVIFSLFFVLCCYSPNWILYSDQQENAVMMRKSVLRYLFFAPFSSHIFFCNLLLDEVCACVWARKRRWEWGTNGQEGNATFEFRMMYYYDSMCRHLDNKHGTQWTIK